MVHRHAHRGHGPNLERRKPDSGDGDIHVVYVTAPATFDGDIGGFVTGQPETKTKQPMVDVGDALQATQTSSAEESEKTGDTEEQTTQEPKTHSEQQETQTADEKEPTKTEPATTTTNNQQNRQTTLSTATADATRGNTRASATDPDLGQVTAATSASSSSDDGSSGNLSTTSKGSSSGDMSGGAKAGIAIGVVLAVALIAALVFFLVRKKKQNQKMREIEDEKMFGNLGPLPEPQTPSIPEARTPVEPPQLDVRPVTQFAPFGLGNTSAPPESAAAGTAAGAAAHQSPPHTPRSTASRKDPFGDPVNPFENRTEPPSPAGASRSVSPPDASSAVITQSGSAPGAAAAPGAVASKAKTSEKGLPAVPEPENAASQSQQPQGSTGPSPNRALTPDAISVASSNVSAGAPAVALAGAPGPAVSSAPGSGSLNVHRVQMDFTPSMDDELSLRSGQLIRLLHEYDDGWALCIRLNSPQQGVAPRSCLSARPVKPRPRPPPGAAPGPHGPPAMGPNGHTPLPGQSPRFYPASDGRPAPLHALCHRSVLGPPGLPQHHMRRDPCPQGNFLWSHGLVLPVYDR